MDDSIKIELMKHQAIMSNAIAELHTAQYKHALAETDFHQWLTNNNLTINEAGQVSSMAEMMNEEAVA